MVEMTASPVFVLHFAGTPTGTAATGTYGYDDTNKLPYIYDGTSWNALPTSTAINTRLLGQMSIEILRLEANASVVGTGYTDEVVDVYSDSNGYNNTLNLTNTTGLFSTNLYNNSNGTGSGTTDSSNNTQNSTEGGITQKGGFKIANHSGTRKMTKITKHASCTATTGYLLASDHSTVLASAAFSGNDCTIDYTLTASTTYYIAADSGGGAYTRTYISSAPSYPQNGTNIDYTTGFWNGGDSSGDAINIVSVTTNALANADRIVETNAQSLAITPTAFQITGYAETVTGTGTITYDVSFDGGSHYLTAKVSGTRYAIVNTGTSMILRQNLNAGASAGSASAKGYSINFV